MAEFIDSELDGDSSEEQPTTLEQRQEARKRMLALGMQRIERGLDPFTGEEQKPFAQVGEEGRKRAESRNPTSIFRSKDQEA
jgi:hypothetical protein